MLKEIKIKLPTRTASAFETNYLLVAYKLLSIQQCSMCKKCILSSLKNRQFRRETTTFITSFKIQFLISQFVFVC